MKVTVKELAEKLGVAESTIRDRIRRGELKAVRHSKRLHSPFLVEMPDAPAGDEVAAPKPEVKPVILVPAVKVPGKEQNLRRKPEQKKGKPKKEEVKGEETNARDRWFY